MEYQTVAFRGFSDLVRRIRAAGMKVVLVGGKEDESLCKNIVSEAQGTEVYLSAGRFSILQSAELLRRCAVLVSNDSAPMHLAVAMKTPVVAVFGATVPAFGFAPYRREGCCC